jgi:hypothetical protein
MEPFERLCSMAADEPAPLDVADRVLAAIRAGRPRTDRVLWSGAVLAGAAAAAAAVLAVQAWLGLQDPFAELVEPFLMVMQ